MLNRNLVNELCACLGGFSVPAYLALSRLSFRLFIIFSRERLPWHNRSVVRLLFFERPCSIQPQTACAALGRMNLQPLGAIKVTQRPAESTCAHFDATCQPASYDHLQFAMHTWSLSKSSLGLAPQGLASSDLFLFSYQRRRASAAIGPAGAA